MDLSLEVLPKFKDRELVHHKLNESTEMRVSGIKEVVNATAIFDPLFQQVGENLINRQPSTKN